MTQILSTISTNVKYYLNLLNEKDYVKNAKTNLNDVADKIEKFIEAHQSKLLFCVSSVTTFYLSPGSFLFGAGIGAVGSGLFDEKTLKTRLVTPLTGALSTLGVIGSGLTYNYSGSIMKSFPVLGGAVAGNFLYHAYKKIEKKFLNKSEVV